MTDAYLYVAAAPKEPTRVTTLTREEGVRQVLEHPPFTRYEGWNLVTLDRPELVGGRRLSVSNGRRKHIDLFEDGTFLVFGTLVDFLAWNRRDLPDKLNSLALIEFVYNALLVYDRILGDLEPLPAELRLAIGLRHAHQDDGRRVYLPAGPVDGIDYETDWNVRYAPDPNVERSIDVHVLDDEPHFDLGATTYALVVKLYNWFGYPDEAVPYANAERTRIEIEQIGRRA